MGTNPSKKHRDFFGPRAWVIGKSRKKACVRARFLDCQVASWAFADRAWVEVALAVQCLGDSPDRLGFSARVRAGDILSLADFGDIDSAIRANRAGRQETDGPRQRVNRNSALHR
jgi:hypothetical protein